MMSSPAPPASSSSSSSSSAKFLRPSFSKASSWTAPPLLTRTCSFFDADSCDSNDSQDHDHDGQDYEDVDLTEHLSKALSLRDSGSDHMSQTNETGSLEENDDDDDSSELYRLCELALDASPKKSQMQPAHFRAQGSPVRVTTPKRQPPSLTFCLSSDDHDLESNRIANDIQALSLERQDECGLSLQDIGAPNSPVFVGVFHHAKTTQGSELNSNSDGVFREKKSLHMS